MTAVSHGGGDANDPLLTIGALYPMALNQ